MIEFVYIAVFQDPKFDDRIELHTSCFLTMEDGMALFKDDIKGEWRPIDNADATHGVMCHGKEVELIMISRLPIQRL